MKGIRVAACLLIALVIADARWLGCYQDQEDDRDLDGTSIEFIEDNSPAKCNEFCYDQGFTYFGLQSSTMCSCGDSYGKHGKLRVGRCAKLCPDSLLANWYCGDELRNQIFETQEPSDPAVPIPDSAAVQYIGCFVDDEDRDLIGARIRFHESNSPEKCGEFCRARGFKIFGLQWGKTCWCDESYGRYGSAPESECYKPCTDPNSQATCGGGFRNSIYEFVV